MDHPVYVRRFTQSDTHHHLNIGTADQAAAAQLTPINVKCHALPSSSNRRLRVNCVDLRQLACISLFRMKFSIATATCTFHIYISYKVVLLLQFYVMKIHVCSFAAVWSVVFRSPFSAPPCPLRRRERERVSVSEQCIYRLAQKSKPLPNDQKMVLKPVNEIKFIRQIKV